MSAAPIFNPEHVQGSQEWLDLRKTKITATDSATILGLNPWKTRLQLYYEKTSDDPPRSPNEAMIRGLELEPIARDLFKIKTGYNMQPRVVIKDWAMASLDGINSLNEILEIKCPGDKVHAVAVAGNIPEYYYPQLQHQMYVCDSQKAFYFSFNGADGVIIDVKRDNEYIEKMVDQELNFYQCLINKTPPEPQENDYIQRNDVLWSQCAYEYKTVSEMIKRLEKKEDDIRKQLIFLSGESNTKGAGISLCNVHRKGTVDYSKVPELKGVNVEKYRKPSSSNWRITCA